jgi:hypothetical protein
LDERTEAATIKLVSRKIGSAAIVAVKLFAAEIAAIPVGRRGQHRRLPTLGRGTEPLLPGRLGVYLLALGRGQGGQLSREPPQVVGIASHDSKLHAWERDANPGCIRLPALMHS